MKQARNDVFTGRRAKLRASFSVAITDAIALQAVITPKVLKPLENASVVHGDYVVLEVYSFVVQPSGSDDSGGESGGNDSGVASRSATKAYTQGDVVSHAGKTRTAQW
ncbi:hypothetical protein [Endozoicomonas euniceicola]|uniref:Uncharacterized protein n=1 Tax=Endozoicomonas euniceicola TaxID=1234143 RepID=A0ABY6GSD2_9GAMM|nr:hypothetical protein [Endozoicomonas euniceicola]UYM15672.1 hypothetical protein NX720_23040 [Endozoicomonas euniceicola]